MNFTGSTSSLFLKKLQSPMGTVALLLFRAFPWKLPAAKGLRLNGFRKKSHSRIKIQYVESMSVTQLQVQLVFINIFKNV